MLARTPHPVKTRSFRNLLAIKHRQPRPPLADRLSLRYSFFRRHRWPPANKFSACNATNPRNTAPAINTAPSARAWIECASPSTACTIVPTAAKPATSPGPVAYSRAEKSSPPSPLPRSRRTPRRRCGWRHARLRRRRRPPQRQHRTAQNRRSLRLQTLLRLSPKFHHALPGYFPPPQRSHPSRSLRPRRPASCRKTQAPLGRRRRHPMRIPRKFRRPPPNQIPFPRLLIHIWTAVALPPLLRMQPHHPISTSRPLSF